MSNVNLAREGLALGLGVYVLAPFDKRRWSGRIPGLGPDTVTPPKKAAKAGDAAAADASEGANIPGCKGTCAKGSPR